MKYSGPRCRGRQESDRYFLHLDELYPATLSEGFLNVCRDLHKKCSVYHSIPPLNKRCEEKKKIL